MKKKKYFKSPPQQVKTNIEKFARVLLLGSFFSFSLATFFSGFPVLAFAWNIVSPSTSEYLTQVLSSPISYEANQSIKDSTITDIDESTKYTLPQKDPLLPTQSQVTIPKIKVETKILEESLENYELALKQGVWRVPNFGDPLTREKPIILVAHRFGYLNWDQAYREKNSFFNLPQVSAGDKIEIIWDQRKFVYEVYDTEEGTDITQYDADLILYTCKFLKSDIRIFTYARLIED